MKFKLEAPLTHKSLHERDYSLEQRQPASHVRQKAAVSTVSTETLIPQTRRNPRVRRGKKKRKVERERERERERENILTCLSPARNVLFVGTRRLVQPRAGHSSCLHKFTDTVSTCQRYYACRVNIIPIRSDTIFLFFPSLVHSRRRDVEPSPREQIVAGSRYRNCQLPTNV